MELFYSSDPNPRLVQMFMRKKRQLRWSDVQVETHNVNGKEQKLARITVRAETS